MWSDSDEVERSKRTSTDLLLLSPPPPRHLSDQNFLGYFHLLLLFFLLTLFFYDMPSQSESVPTDFEEDPTNSIHLSLLSIHLQSVEPFFSGWLRSESVDAVGRREAESCALCNKNLQLNAHLVGFEYGFIWYHFEVCANTPKLRNCGESWGKLFWILTHPRMLSVYFRPKLELYKAIFIYFLNICYQMHQMEFESGLLKYYFKVTVAYQNSKVMIKV